MQAAGHLQSIMLRLLLSFIFGCGLQNQIATAVLRLSEDDLAQMSTDFDVTYPIQVDNNGNFLGNNMKALHRNRRSVDYREVPHILSENKDHSSGERENLIYLNITAFGTIHKIVLKPKKKLTAPEATVFQQTRQGFTENSLQADFVYAGHVVGHTKSIVAITTFNGLAGYIKMDDGEFFIEPLEDARENGILAPQRHAIYKTQNRHRTNDESREENKRSQRSKRYTKRMQYNIEVLLMADDTVVQFHGSDGVQSYLITLMNIVDEIYQDDSIGHSINVVVVRLSFLSRQHADKLIAGEDPAASLKNVCKWAFDMHHIDGGHSGATTYDHAIFLTRRQFGPIGMEGYAHVTGMCHPLRSCTLNHEDGFSSAFVVAHETGHVLGMEHDGEGNKCGDETSMGSIMAPLVQAAFHRYHWSRCSQYELKGNIRKFDCLLNSPHAPGWSSNEEYPGVYYSLDDQCRFDFGPGYRQCTAFQNIDICSTLWCSHGDNPLFCKTKNGPPVDGTECAENMWCFKSHCVWRNQRRGRVDGQWGQWALYGLCSRSCGTGIMTRTRQCDRPRPQFGGQDCLGSHAEHILCNTRPCTGSYDYRAEQCRYHQKKEYGNRRHTWLPYESEHGDLKCELFCISKETGIVLSMGSPVADGTSCSYDDPYDVCVNAECVRVGCDGVIGSSKREDECGVCEGDGSQCRRINSTYRKLVRKPRNSYMKMFTLPVRARQVIVREPSANNSPVIALKNRRTGRYILNQKGAVAAGDVRKQIIDAGTKWVYVKANGREDLRAVGPLSSEYAALVVLKTHVKKLKVHYSYVLHSSDLDDTVYQYEIRKWYACSVTCGEGTRLARFGCRNKATKKWVRKSYCNARAPRRLRKACSSSCQPRVRWSTSRWSICSVSCGEGGIKTRTVYCERHLDNKAWEAVNDIECSNVTSKPSLRKSCTRTACPASWVVGNWSLCSVSCGEGRRQRKVNCSSGGRIVGDEECSKMRPFENESCRRQDCTDDTCDRDNSIFCKLPGMAEYCSLTGYSQLCCDLCRSSGGPREH